MSDPWENQWNCHEGSIWQWWGHTPNRCYLEMQKYDAVVAVGNESVRDGGLVVFRNWILI